MSTSASSERTNAEQEKALRHSIVVREGLKATAYATPAIALGVYAANRWWPLYRGLTPQFKMFTVVAGLTAVFFTATDRIAMWVEREAGFRYSVSNKQEASAAGVDLGTDGPPFTTRPGSITDKLAHWVVDARYHIIGYGWAAVVGSTIAYTWRRRDITLTQKLINARLLGQTAALSGVALIAGLTANVTAPPAPVDAYFERVVSAGASTAPVSTGKHA
jgi:hypothetical protein